jgi:signal transduction histidine kinase
VLIDSLLAAVLAVLTVATPTDHVTYPLALALTALSAAPIAVRRQAPMSAMVVMFAASMTYFVLYRDVPNTGIDFVVCLFSVATYRPRHIAALGGLITMVMVVIAFRFPAGWDWWGLTQNTLFFGVAWVLGVSTRNWSQRAERAEQGIREERGRIARELHDIVAHHMCVISLQAGIAEYVLNTDPLAVGKALATVSATSREALAEMRRLLDVLRMDDTEDADMRPQPGLADLDRLVWRIRDAGVPVEFQVTGTAIALSAGPDLCAYRTAQEALTNVLKHAGPATARLAVDYGEQELTVSVTDDGAASPRAPQRDQRGLAGLRERATLYGGTLTAGPRPEGGFHVVVRLPI